METDVKHTKSLELEMLVNVTEIEKMLWSPDNIFILIYDGFIPSLA